MDVIPEAPVYKSQDDSNNPPPYPFDNSQAINAVPQKMPQHKKLPALQPLPPPPPIQPPRPNLISKKYFFWKYLFFIVFNLRC